MWLNSYKGLELYTIATVFDLVNGIKPNSRMSRIKLECLTVFHERTFYYFLEQLISLEMIVLVFGQEMASVLYLLSTHFQLVLS